MARRKVAWWLFGTVLAIGLIPLLGGAAFGQEAGQAAATATAQDSNSAIAYSIAIVMAAACLAAGYAVGRVGSAAFGAASERPELLGRSLILVGLAEGIAIYGLIIGLMLLFRLK